MVDDEFTAPHLATSALLVIDVQRDFLDGGASPIPGTDAVLPAVRRLVGAYRAAALPVVHVVRLYRGDDVDLPRRRRILDGELIVRPGTPGAEVPEELLPGVVLDVGLLLAGGLQPVGEREWVMWKPRWSAFHRTPLEAHLTSLDVDTVVVAGCNFPNCPRATILDASARDLRVAVAPDATSQVTPERLDDAIAIGAKALTVGEIVAALPG